MKELDKSQKLECLDWLEEQVVNGREFICIIAKCWLKNNIYAKFDDEYSYLYKAFPELVDEILSVGNAGAFDNEEGKIYLKDILDGVDIHAFALDPDDVKKVRLQVISTVRQNLNK